MQLSASRPFSRDVGRVHQNGGRSRYPSQRPCRFFISGRCREGNQCRYLHSDVSNPDGSEFSFRNSRPRNLEQTESDQEVRRQFSALQRRLKFLLMDDSAEREQLWSDILKILETDDKEYQQRVVKVLVSDEGDLNGLAHIRELLNARPNRYTQLDFVRLVGHFLKVITHSGVINCLSLDVEVGDLYSFISGSGGSRGIPFFTRVAEAFLDQTSALSKLISSEASLSLNLIALVTAIQEMFCRCPRALLNEDTPALGGRLSQLSTFIKDDDSLQSNLLTLKIPELTSMIQRAQDRLSKDGENKDGLALQLSSTTVSTYYQDIELPVDRHDNDKMDIGQINIIPTEDEIRSQRPEFLPSPLSSRSHFLVGKERHIDTHFRLHRHDIFGELKVVLGGLLNTSVDTSLRDNIKFSESNANTFVYINAGVTHITSSKKQGIEVQIAFQSPSDLWKMSKIQCQQWWNATKRLEEGSLLCLISPQDGESTALFFTVTAKNTEPSAKFGLASGNKPVISGRFVSTVTTRQLRSLILNFGKTNGLLVEASGIIPATFMPVLENLQRMQRQDQLPFAKWVLQQESDTGYAVPPPLYARTAGFSFDLSPILIDPTNPLAFRPGFGIREAQRQLEQHTTLDKGQCESLIAALSREFTLIQGPPGTGKSYVGVQLMRVLLANKARASLGPIVVVCYTNHALDQFLEHLLAVGIEKVIRIGGNSSSPKLEGKNLRVISKFQSKTGTESRTLGIAYGEKDLNEYLALKQFERLRGLKNYTWISFRDHLMRKYHSIYRQFSLVDADGFMKMSKIEPFNLWKTGKGENFAYLNKPCEPQDLTTILLSAHENVYSLALGDRDVLLKHWTTEITEDIINTVSTSVKDSSDSQNRIDLVHGETDRRLLQTADVIGVTTTGMAKNVSVLRRINAKIVICEEAGEVLEAHMLSVLIPSIQHLIQIGDHEQLRPQIANFNLFSLESDRGKQYQLDRSLFERLAVQGPGKPRFPIAQLNVQRRMRPEISRFVRDTLYDKLVDHSDTLDLGDVVGMRKNVFWYHHTNLEDRELDGAKGRSHSNDAEVDMTHALVQHIVRQGVYKSSEIAVLTPYAGQLRKLQLKFSSSFEVVLGERDQDELARTELDILASLLDWATPQREKEEKQKLQKKSMNELLRVATVDNFQGEEAKIIIISLVRSNKLKKVGFLKTTNRINVLLSRAQHGMYIIGNADTYSHVQMWSKVLDMLREANSVGEAFSLCCPRHPETEILAATPEDFEFLSPEGGCKMSCDRRLAECGHRCMAKCHSDMMHEVFKCSQPCERIFDQCDHPCPRTCGEPCGRCKVPILNVTLPCSHVKEKLPCHVTAELGKIDCMVPVTVTLTDCSHTMQVPCKSTENLDIIRCNAPCTAVLGCGHQCLGTCASCKRSNIDGSKAEAAHETCRRPCGRPYGTCSHICQKPCHATTRDDCGICMSNCEVRCGHSRCDQRCHAPCTPCIQMCTWACKHQGACTLPCSAPCNRLPCSRRCNKFLECGHQCPSLCGEVCPSNYCQVCSTKGDEQVDLILFEKYSEIDLDSSPIVVLACGHFFTAESLDGTVGLAEVYETDKDGKFTELRDISPIQNQAVPRCPNCKRTIQQFVTQRYNRAVNRAIMDETTKRFLTNGKAKLQALEEKIFKLEDVLTESRKEMTRLATITGFDLHNGMSAQRNVTISEQMDHRYQDYHDLIAKADGLLESVSHRNQPARKLHDATLKAIQASGLESQMRQLSINHSSVAPAINQIVFHARAVQLLAKLVTLVDMFECISVLRDALGEDLSIVTSETDPIKAAVDFFVICSDFIISCKDESFPRPDIEARLHYARLAMLYRSYISSNGLTSTFSDSTERIQTAKGLLAEAKLLSDARFEGADDLRQAIEDMEKLLGKEWYESVSPEELASIKAAMVKGKDGLATNSGHWYNCQNGHPFAVGECGFPMQMARCPECGAPVGGEDHVPTVGVTRAVEME